MFFEFIYCFQFIGLLFDPGFVFVGRRRRGAFNGVLGAALICLFAVCLTHFFLCVLTEFNHIYAEFKSEWRGVCVFE